MFNIRSIVVFVFFSAVCLALALPSCTPTTSTDYTAEGSPAKGDMLVSASLGEATNLVWFLASDQSSHAMAGMLYESLLRYDGDLNIQPNLAETYTVSPDGLTITFTLRGDVYWQDGTPLTAQDVLATFNAITNPNTRTAYAGDYLMVEKALAPTPHTFVVHYAKPFAPALASWVSFAVLPKHILEQNNDINTTSLKTTPVGSGAYVLKEWRRATDATFVANPTYFKGEPWITGQQIRVIPDQDTQFMELQAGNIDTMSLKPLQFHRLTNNSRFSSTYNKYQYLSNGYTYLGFNLKKPLFKNKKVRQALSYATPRDHIINTILMGEGMAITAPFKPGTWAYNTTLKPYDYNIDKAKELLKEDGWSDNDNDGILDKTINGKKMPLRFTVVTNQGNDQRIKAAEMMQQSFASIGVDMQIRVQEWSTFIEQTLYGRNFDAVILGWSLTPEPDPYDIWHSSKQGPREFNVIGFENADADAAMEAARSTFNQTLRKHYLDRFQAIIHEEQPYLFLFAPYSLVTVHKRIKGIIPKPAGIAYNSENWYVPAEQQVRSLPAFQP